MKFKKYSWLISLAVIIAIVVVIVNIDNILNIDLESQSEYMSEEEFVQFESEQIQFVNNPDGILIEVFSDFECPMCIKSFPILHSLIAKYNGQINFQYKHLPLDYHKHAFKAALASECARDQDKFLEYHDLLFRKGADGDLQNYAQALGLDIEKFSQCLISEEKAPVVQRDIQEAMARGVEGTPWFFVDGEFAWLDEIEPMIIDKLQK
ncbi:DsbA family protein [Candidatus Woesearchaeota archaeon]|nr:DsbA family protein [Candidatus Woesearchaeota archaeon]